jgi:hypothetical protein
MKEEEKAAMKEEEKAAMKEEDPQILTYQILRYPMLANLIVTQQGTSNK